jgi:hypothetical protein
MRWDNEIGIRTKIKIHYYIYTNRRKLSEIGKGTLRLGKIGMEKSFTCMYGMLPV